MLRRLLGIVLAASMAHLGIAGSDLICAAHGGHPLAQQQPAPMGDMHHHDGGQGEKERCKVPASGDCCEAMTTCAVSAALASAPEPEPLPYHESDVVAFIADAPLTRLIPPDPPPPKA